MSRVKPALSVRCCGNVDKYGRVAERLKAPVLKTGNGQPFVGSNPTSSATPPTKSPPPRSVFHPLLPVHRISILDASNPILLYRIVHDFGNKANRRHGRILAIDVLRNHQHQLRPVLAATLHLAIRGFTVERMAEGIGGHDRLRTSNRLDP